MKTIKEIQTMLRSELLSRLDNLEFDTDGYFNEALGDTSFLLASLLELHLKDKFQNWDQNKWIDDSLISSVNYVDYKLSICGVIIWGLENSTGQWTEPFCFKAELNPNKPDQFRYTFLFSDSKNSEISYEEFTRQRDYWSEQARNWNYIITI